MNDSIILFALCIAGIVVCINAIPLLMTHTRTFYSDIIKKQLEIFNDIQTDMDILLKDKEKKLD